MRSITGGRGLARVVGVPSAMLLLASTLTGTTALGTAAQGEISTQAVGGGSFNGRITIDDETNAFPYPATINISGIPGRIVDLDVTLRSIAHDKPDDIDVLLVAPDDTAVIIMSDAGGDADLSSTTVILDDEVGDKPLPNETRIESDRYRSTNYDQDADIFGGSAPSPSPDGTLNAFDDINPNGPWRLYVRDDADNGIGAFQGGYSLRIETENNDPIANDDTFSGDEGETLRVRAANGVLRNDRDPDNDKLTAQRITRPRHGSVQLDDGGGFTYRPENGFSGTDSFIYEASDGVGGSDRARVTITVAPERRND